MSPRRVPLLLVLALAVASTAHAQQAPAPSAGLSHDEFFDWAFYHNAGWKALSMGETDRAEYLFGKGIEIARAEAATDPRLLARGYADFAWVLHLKGRDADAEPLARWALEVRERAFGVEGRQVSSTVYTLGAIELGLGKLAEAEQLMDRALAIGQKWNRPDSPPVADATVDLAAVLVLRRAYDRARPLLERALMTYRQVDPQHPGQLAALDGLATIALQQGRAADAEARLDEALAMLATDPLADPRYLAATLRRKADLARKAGRDDEARLLDDQAKEADARRRLFSPAATRQEVVNDDPRGQWIGTTRRKPPGR